MADVTKIFKPRRGKKSTMAGTKATTVLSAGELFVEVPDTGAGTGHSMIKIGDGTTAYSSLPYAIGDTSNDTITFTSDASTTATAALNNVVSGAALKTLIAGLKQAVSLNASSISTLNDEYTQISTNFQNGCSTIASSITSHGVSTASNASPSTMANNISTLATNKYNQGVTAADNRAEPNSINYQTGYAAKKETKPASVTLSVRSASDYNGDQYTTYTINFSYDSNGNLSSVSAPALGFFKCRIGDSSSHTEVTS